VILVEAASGQTRRFTVGEVPPLAAEYTARPESAAEAAPILVPGSAVALASRSVPFEGQPDWRGVCGKTQIAAMIANSLRQSGIVDSLVWISATDRAAVLSGFAQASAAAGVAPIGKAESGAARFASWLRETSQAWLVVFDDLAESAVPEELWPQGPSGRLIITSTRPAAIAYAAQRGARVVPVGFFSRRESVNYLTERLSANPAQRHGAMELADELRCEPLALAQAASVVANSTLACRDYRDYFARRRQQMGADPDEVPAAEVTWTLSLGQAESLLPGMPVRLMLILVALLDGHGIPGAVLSAPSVAAYMGGSADPSSPAADPRPAWDALLVLERTGLVSVSRAAAGPVIFMNSALQAAIRLSAPARVQEPAARAAASALLETWPAEEPQPWAAERLRTRCGPAGAIRCCCGPAEALTTPA
jgi:hypothetical protein